jgi:HD superfamily phosphodiesterase
MRKQSKLSKKNRRQDIKVDVKATRTLRTLGNEEAFHFYEDIDKPTGENARSLRDFSERIESVKLESLVFHLKRNDFKNWIENTLEDPKLAKRLEKIPVTYNKRLRTEISAAVRNRLKELEETSDLLTICVDKPAITVV